MSSTQRKEEKNEEGMDKKRYTKYSDTEKQRDTTLVFSFREVFY